MSAKSSATFRVERLPLVRGENTIEPHDLSSGLRRHMPVVYSELGASRRDSAVAPLLIAVLWITAFGLLLAAMS